MWIRARLTILMVALACLACPAGAAAATAASAPATVFDPETHSQGVYFQGSDGSLREMAWTAASGWSQVFAIAPGGSLGSAPAAVFDPETHSQGIYFEGPQGALREIYWTPSGGWSSVSTVAPAGSLGSAPTAVFDPETHSQGVYFEGPDGSLREMAWTPSGGWSPVYTILPAHSLGSAPAANFDPEYHSQNVYFTGADGSLREISWTPSSGWDTASVITPGSGAIPSAPTGPASAPQPSGTGSVTLAPRHRKHRLAVRIVMKWHWNRGHTRLLWVKIGRAPGRTVFSITCRGRGCPARRLRADAATLRRHHRTLHGKVYRAGDRLLVSLTAPGWRTERARITIRNGRIPSVHLL